MMNALAHRGPNGEGRYQAPAASANSPSHLAMGMRRLSIIDLVGGTQPLRNEDDSLILIANGEIYNFIELRSELISQGHRFETGSDCEVILHLYEEYELEFVHRLRGMFAFALWDTRAQRLIVGRDRMGEKPLYVFGGDRKLWFASELRALMTSGQVPLSLSPSSIDSYMHFGWVPEPDTMVRGVRKLPPGHLLIIDARQWSLQEYCYWRLEDVPPVEGDAVPLVREQLETIGRQIIRADVPVGVALSGGFDSSLVAALAKRHSAAPIHAFTVGYVGSPPQDERNAAARFAQDIGLEFHQVELDVTEMVDIFPQLAWWCDDPIADIAGFGYYALSRRARQQNCPVLLQGQGADELLWGYSWAVKAVLHSQRQINGRPIGVWEALWAQFPRSMARPDMVRALYQFAGLMFGWRDLCPAAAGGATRISSYELSDTYQKGATGASATYAAALRDALADHQGERLRFMASADPRMPVDIQLISLLCRGYLLQNGLAQGDRLSMANSVELRLPLVDSRLVELLVGIQKRAPAYLDQPKRLLHEAADAFVPGYIRARPKRGFSPPSAEWLRELRQRYTAQLIDGHLVRDGFLARGAAIRLCRPASRFSVAPDLLFKYLALEFWYQGMKDAGSRQAQVH